MTDGEENRDAAENATTIEVEIRIGSRLRLACVSVTIAVASVPIVRIALRDVVAPILVGLGAIGVLAASAGYRS
jgi:hypothetical protein